ncbi:MAG: hypothetical protein ACKOSO_00955, partial [Actinomycetota bacterium]
MTRVLVSGATGRLGAPICAALAAADDLVLAGRVARSLGGGDGFPDLAAAIADTRAEVVIDVTRPAAAAAHCQTASAAGVPLVLGTPGMAAEGAARVDAAARAAGVPVLFCPHFAITAVLMMRFADVQAAREAAHPPRGEERARHERLHRRGHVADLEGLRGGP